ncbi:MAG: ribosome-associated translation inhibitor RaiA [Verrucomicrobiota bacterium]|nr:ribosome-associated translation inhibitor RaiA [Verrucomicrobiota bacterium]
MSKPILSPGDHKYNLSVIGKHVQITDAIRNYVLEKLNKVERITDQIIDVIVTVDSQKLEQSCSVLMNFIHFHIKVSASTDNMYSAIDKCMDRLLKLIRKYKSKLQSKRFKDLTTVDMHVNVIQPLQDDLKAINDDIEAETVRKEQERLELHQVVAKETMKLKTLTQDEALIKMEISEEPFLIFRGEEDQKLKVIYRRKDDNYGLVQIQ